MTTTISRSKCQGCLKPARYLRIGEHEHCVWCGTRKDIEIIKRYDLNVGGGLSMRDIPLPMLPRDFPTHDNTMLSAFNRCPRLYELLYIRKKRRGGTAALEFGSFMHLMLSTWYDQMVNIKKEPMEALAHVLSLAERARYETYADDFRTKERAIQMMIEYAQFFGYFEPKRRWKIIFAETGFDLIGPHFGYGGKIDLLVELDGKLYIVDHKTTSRFGKDFYDKFVPDTQTAGYIWAAERLHGKPIEGVIVNTIVVHKVKKAPDVQFQYREFTYPRFFIDEWYHQALHSLYEIHLCHQQAYFRPRWQSCVNEYGKCTAFDLCRSMPENRLYRLETEWRDYTWDWREVEIPEGGPEEEGPILLEA